MLTVQSGCVIYDYAWEGSVPQSSDDTDTSETTLHVAFDYGAQHLFSGVRISIYCSAITQGLLETYQLEPRPPFRVSSPPLGNPVDELNASSLPMFNATFEIEQTLIESDFSDVLATNGAQGCCFGQLTFMEDPQEDPRQKLFEIIQPLTADTKYVSVSFTHSLLLYTQGPCGTGRLLDGSFNFGRVVRVQPMILPFNHKTISVPTEILLMIFENISDSSRMYKWWRRDLFYCALVCKQWTCALGMLLNDFGYPWGRGHLSGYPPEIRRFANALALRPSLGLSIAHLSPNYFVRHASWKDFPLGSRLSQRRQSLPHTQTSGGRIGQFVTSLSSVLRHAKNLKSLSLPWGWSPDLPEEFLDALRGLDKLEEFHMQSRNTPEESYPYLAMWPTLKRLSIGPCINGRTGPIPTSPPDYKLTEATLHFVGDEHLKYILSSSSSSLERLTIGDPFMTNGGLHAALQSVARSLVMLRINHTISPLGEEEPALDSLIVDMVRLKSLSICRGLATNRMIKQRADAFQRSRMLDSYTPLPVIELMIDQSHHDARPEDSLVTAAAEVWPGWKIEITEPYRDFDPE